MKNGDWSQMGLTNSPERKDGGESLRLDESDSFERAIIRGVVSSSRAVLDGSFGERVADDDVRLQTARSVERELSSTLEENRMGVEELEILVRYLPRDFMLAYLRLIDAGVGERNLGSGRGAGTEGSGKEYGTRSGVQIKSESKDYRGGAVRKGKPSSGNGIPIQSENAIDDRKRIDKRLRQIGREIKALLVSEGEERSVLRRKCSGSCKRLGSAEDLYCSYCGSPMMDVVPSMRKKKK